MVPEEIIIRKLKEGDKTALGLLYDKYAAILYGQICKHFEDRAKCDKVLTGVVRSVFSSIDSYNPAHGRLLTWMYHITSAEIKKEALL